MSYIDSPDEPSDAIGKCVLCEWSVVLLILESKQKADSLHVLPSEFAHSQIDHSQIDHSIFAKGPNYE